MERFMLGAATAAHQVEGNNIYSDFWHMEHMKNTRFEEPSNKAVNHYEQYEEDIKYLKEAKLNTYRFSIEWARIEPRKGYYDLKEVEHYENVLKYCVANGITPIVTMHHFSSPKWLICEGGWENEEVIEWFSQYCKFMVEKLGDYLEYVCTINEANMGLQIAAKINRMLNDKNGLQVGLSDRLLNNQAESKELYEVFGVAKAHHFLTARSEESDLIVMKAHVSAKEEMKKVKPELRVGMTLSLHDFQDQGGGDTLIKKEWNEEFRRYIKYIKEDDFFGLQNYSRKVFDQTGVVKHPKDEKSKTQMGYENSPESLENVIRKVCAEIDIPIIITENGIATSDDAQRIAFITQALKGVQRCIADGLNIKGYIHWSLLDNFEWQKGFAYTFGLIEVDRNTFERKPKPSLKYLGNYIDKF